MDLSTILLTSSVVAALVTLGISRFLKWLDDDRLRSATKKAIQAEIDRASDFGIAYLDPGTPREPLHRISTTLYVNGIARLVALGGLDYNGTQALVRYYDNIEQLNRSLELILEHKNAGRIKDAAREASRAYLKAASIVPGKDMRRILADHRLEAWQRRTIASKLRKYRGRTPFDEVKAHMGLV